ncbi:MAG: GH92 family glycosyl hydrolase [Hyphomicrobiales bacterium]
MTKFKLTAVFLLSSLLFAFSGCNKKTEPADFVDPFIGTGGHGHTYPGASLPFGMVQLSPDTRIDDWDHCSGYHYSDSLILGFSHTHLSGTGCGDYGDIRITPIVGEIKYNPASFKHPKAGYSSAFKHENETAEPGYYSVFLDDYKVKAELTATKRTGMHKYTFPKSDNSHLLIDLTEAVVSEQIHNLEANIISNTEISGCRQSGSWARNQHIYFYMVLSQPFDSYSAMLNDEVISDKKNLKGKNLKLALNYNTNDNQEIVAKVGISAVSIEEAKNNLLTENPDMDFNKVRKDAYSSWNKKLSKIKVKGNDDKKTVFYTAMYHAYLSPDLYSDVSGTYRGHDDKIYTDKDKNQYTVFSLWDTFRAEHPLLNIIEPKVSSDFINSMLNIYKTAGKLPVWELAANETNCMIGYHSIPVILDAYNKGIRDFDLELAYEAMTHSANQKEDGIYYMNTYGYVPGDLSGESVSKTLEYSYNDWCIAQFARILGKENDYNFYIQRAQNYKNIFEKNTGFMRGKRNGGFEEPFDPLEVNFFLTEANSWQYTFFAPQDITGLIDIYGGVEGFEKKLDDMFSAKTELTGRHQPDISGLIGQYAHGNEPSHHMAYLYNYIQKPEKTQKLVKQICNEMYTTATDGYSGNEDCGQMSAWYVLSSMGLYSVTPGDTILAIGVPEFTEVSFNVKDKAFKIVANNLNENNIYIKEAKLNGKPYQKSYISLSDLYNGGELILEMSTEPSTTFGKGDGNFSVIGIDKDHITPVPYFTAPCRSFKNPITVSFNHLYDDAKYYYTIDGSEPTTESIPYTNPIKIDKTTILKAIAVRNNIISKAATAYYYKMDPNWSIKIAHPYGKQYTAGGNDALIDGIIGKENFSTGDWQGYRGHNIDAIIDMGKRKMINTISTGFIQNIRSWIWMPEKVEYYTSNDGINWSLALEVLNDIPKDQGDGINKRFEGRINKKARYVKVIAKNQDEIPEWHVGAGDSGWIFADEVVIK